MSSMEFLVRHENVFAEFLIMSLELKVFYLQFLDSDSINILADTLSGLFIFCWSLYIVLLNKLFLYNIHNFSKFFLI